MGKLSQSQADRAGHESPGEDCGRPHQTVGVNRWFPVWLCLRQRNNRCNLCCQAAATEVSSCQQEILHGFHRLEQSIWSSASKGHLVGAEKTWCWRVDCATGAGDVCHCVEVCLCWRVVQWRVWSEGGCSPKLGTQTAALHHSAWSLVTQVLLWGPLGGLLCWWPCYHGWITRGMWQEALDLEKSNGGDTTESKCRKDKNHDLWYGPGPLAEFRQVFMCRLSHWSGQQQHLLQWLQVLGAQEMQWAQALDKGPWLQMYTVPGNCMPLGLQATEGSQSQTWQAGGGSFLLLPRRHALSSWWLWTFNHNTCENRLKEVQGAATPSSHFPPPLFQDTWPWVQLLCAGRNASCQWDLAIDKAKPLMSAGKWQGNDQADLQCQAARHCHQILWATCVAWHWGSGPHSEGEKAPLVWTCRMLQWCSQDSLWPIGWWKAWAWVAKDDMEAADREGLQSGSSQLSTLMIDIPGDLVWGLQQASTWKVAHWYGCCPCTCTLIKNSLLKMMMMMMMMIRFLIQYY